MTEKPTSSPNNSEEAPSSEQIRRGVGDLWSGIRKFFRELIDLRDGLDRYGTVKRIRENKHMKGANAWTLMCSIMIASLGLDLNSPAVIIGAMLISPLMSPILGIGLAVGINDRDTLWISLRHFIIAIGIAIFTSTLYFFLTPFGEPTPEILSRTKPTTLDVLVAFFGGLAGIISGTRKDISNAVPGVAIATALMPPVCVTGFGIANMLKYGILHNGQNYLTIASNSFYLFFLNTFFVAFATYIIIRMLRFPYKEIADTSEKRRNRAFFVIVGFLSILPSFYILTNVITDERNKAAIDNFVKNTFSEAASYKITKPIEQDTFQVTINLLYEVESEQKLAYLRKLRNIVPNSNLRIRHPDAIDLDEVNSTVEEKIIAMNMEQQVKISEKDKKINELRATLQRLQSKEQIATQIPDEVRPLFPDLKEVKLYVKDSITEASNPPMLYLEWKGRRNYAKEEEKLVSFVKKRVQLDTVIISRK